MENVIFVDVIGFEGLYEVSNYGRFRNKKLNKIINGTISQNRYIKISLHKDKKLYIKRSHRLVYYSFFPNKIDGLVINHKDLNKLNNRLDNLEEISYRENASHYYKSQQKTSKYIGVSYIKTVNEWRCNIRINGKMITRRGFKDEEEARIGYLELLKEYNITNKYAL